MIEMLINFKGWLEQKGLSPQETDGGRFYATSGVELKNGIEQVGFCSFSDRVIVKMPRETFLKTVWIDECYKGE